MLKTAYRVFCVFLSFALFLPLLASAASDADSVIETNIGIQPFDYKRMISSTVEKKYPVNVEINNGKPHPAQIHIRGCGTKAAGMSIATKRLPIELQFENAAFYAEQIGNTCVKFCNVLSPYELAAQYIAYDMFAFLDIPTPAHSFAFLQYNDVDFGLYFVLEDINIQFLQKHFSQPFGSLFKGGINDKNRSYINSSWFGDIQIVENHGTDRIYALLDALDQGEGYEDYLDVDEVLRFLACTAAYGGASSILTELSNFFLYDTGDKFILLPWDLSEAFSSDITKNGIDHFRMEFWEDAPPSRLFELLMKSDNNRKLYHNYIQKICEEFLDPNIFDAYYYSLVSLASPYLERDCTIWFNWETNEPKNALPIPVTMQSLSENIHHIYDNLKAQLNGTEDTFYIDPILTHIHEEIADELSYIVLNTPTMDLKITNKICKAYSSYCRSRGITHFTTGDPAETAAAAGLFAAVFLVLIVVTRKNRKREKRRK